MPLTYAESSEEFQQWLLANPGPTALDSYRGSKIDALTGLTGRSLIIYAVDFLTPKVTLQPAIQSQISIDLRDKDFFFDMCKGLEGDELDLLIQSPGGSAEAVENIVTVLGDRFRHIRALVPGTAKSAGTMLAFSADELVLNLMSDLGPTDPQLGLNGRFNPAGAIIKQFRQAQDELAKNASLLNAWLPILKMYGPSLVVECEKHLNLSRELVGRWLEHYMFAGDDAAHDRAQEIANWLSDDDQHLTHARNVSMQALIDRGCKVVNLDLPENSELSDAVRALYNAIMLTFQSTNTYKFFENSAHKIMAQAVQMTFLPQAPQQPTGGGG